MHIVDDPIETVHLYVVREEPKQPYTVMPLIAACLCLLAIVGLTVYSGEHPAYEYQTLTLPAQLLPPQTFTATQEIIPTGVKTYPATTAQGTLMITNGSVIAQTIPQDFRIENVVTDVAVYVPAGSANGYGMATVSAHAVAAGKSGNIPAYTINSAVGSSVYIRNLSPFTGGQDSYSVKYATTQDKQTALLQARGILLSKSSGLHYPCIETKVSNSLPLNFVLTWRCQFVSYHIPAFYHVTRVRIVGKNLLIGVWFVAHPVRIWVK